MIICYGHLSKNGAFILQFMVESQVQNLWLLEERMGEGIVREFAWTFTHYYILNG